MCSSACQAVVLLVRLQDWRSECWLLRLCQETDKANLFVHRLHAKKDGRDAAPERHRCKNRMQNMILEKNVWYSVMFKSFGKYFFYHILLNIPNQ